MITNARVLQEEWVPADVEHRHNEVNTLTTSFEPVLHDEPAGNVFLFGPTGVGKTVVSRFVLNLLREQRLDIHTQYVNCWQDHTRFQSLYRMLDEIQQTHDIHRQSTPQDELYRRLRDGIECPYIVVLDEVDQLEDKSLLYELDRIQQLYMIFISNREEDIFGEIDERTRSRLKAERRIQFDRYSVDELSAILATRAEEGLGPGSVSEYQLEYIADAAAGDARVAIHILQTAAREAEANNLTSISDEMIEDAVPEAKESIRQKTIDGLNHHQQVLYEIIVDEGEVGPSSLYDEYRDRVDDPKTERTLRNYLAKLHQYNLIEMSGYTKGRRYSIVGEGEASTSTES